MINQASNLNVRTVPGPALASLGAGAAAPAWDARSPATALTLPEGSRLLDYEVVGPIGEGGFSIVYLAWDGARQQHVAIKEYLPATVAARASLSPRVVVKSPRHAEAFRIGLDSFVNEARLLARFNHPALVKVLQFWQDNGTAYMAMPYYQGPTLARALTELGRMPTEDEWRAWLRPLLHALGTLHAAHCLHRDIAPDNILLTDDGPVLLDFGAARRVVGSMVSAPAVVLKPGYAPIEQYGEAPSMKQGAWTDLYALGAMVYTGTSGKLPMPAVERMMDDRLTPLSRLVPGRYSAPFLATIDAALALRPQGRPQSAGEFWARLNGRPVREGGAKAAYATPSFPAPLEPAPLKPTLYRPAADELRAEPSPVIAAALASRAESALRRHRRRRLPIYLLLAVLGILAYRHLSETRHPMPPPGAAAPARPSAPAPRTAATRAPGAAAPAQRVAVKPPPLQAPTLPPASASTAAPAPTVAMPAPNMPASTERAARSPVRAPDADAPVRAPEPPRRAATALSARPGAVRMPLPPVTSTPRPARETRRQGNEAPVMPVQVPELSTRQAEIRARCSEILQRASIGPLGDGEVELLKKECQ